MSKFKVGLVGAGNIAEAHMAALRTMPGIDVVAVADISPARAEEFAKAWSIPHWGTDLEEAGAGVAVAHVLVPPNLHRPVAEPLLRRGVHVFLEKPMAETPSDCAALQAAAAESGAALEVNQNFPHHPVHQRVRQALARNRIGPARHVSLQYNMPLRQLDAGQLGHWMFQEPRNLLLEQAVHPLSQIDDLLGPILHIDAQPQPPRKAGEGVELIAGWLLSLQCERGTAQVQFSLGQEFPFWALTVIGDDGVIRADMIHGRVSAVRPTPWLDAADSLANGWGEASAIMGESLRAAGSYVAGISGLCGRTDPFFRSMKRSIGAFYAALGQGRRPRAELGARMVTVCGDIARRVNGPKAAPRPATPAASAQFDVALFGGTGFIGRHTLSALLDQGMSVAVFARSVGNLPAIFHRDGVGVFQGSIGDAAAVADLAARAPVMVNLAHGGASGSPEDIQRAMVGGAMTVARAAAAAGCRHLVHVSSIAALYLGGAGSPVTAETPPDPDADRRAAYARAKALAERSLLTLHAEGGMPVSILRPGVVLGQGTSPFHSGIGLFNRPTHCIGWNAGDNGLPLVLVQDVAAAIVAALDNPETFGKTLNLVGDVRLTARDYIAELKRASGRPLAYHPQRQWLLQAEELAKWAVKRAGGRQVPLPSFADLKSRGMPAVFDCRAEKAILKWQPETDRERFLEKAFAGHAA